MLRPEPRLATLGSGASTISLVAKGRARRADNAVLLARIDVRDASAIGGASSTEGEGRRGCDLATNASLARRHRAKGEATPNGRVRFVCKSGPDGRERLLAMGFITSQKKPHP